MEILNWISNWFAAQCDGDWERGNQIKIETVSNPGWHIVIDLTGTVLENLHIENDLVEINSDDWFFFMIKEKQFIGSGDLSKLTFLLNSFREIVEKNSFTVQ